MVFHDFFGESDDVTGTRRQVTLTRLGRDQNPSF